MNINLVAGYQKIITILLLILVGFLAKRSGVINKETQSGLTNLMIKVVIPFAVFSAFLTPFDWVKARTGGVLIVLAIVFYPVMQFLVGKALYFKYPRDKDKQRLFAFGTTYSNAVFMGYPFLQALFGKEGLFFGSVFNLPYNVYLWSIGFAQFTRQPLNKDGIKNTMTNPVIIACLLGYLYWLTQGLIPAGAKTALAPVWDVFSTVGAANTPLSMLVIGAILGDARIGRIVFDKEIWYFSFCKLLLVPGLVFAALYFAGYRSWVLAIPTAICAMPTCATGGIRAGRYEIQKEMAVSLITFTTVLSAATAPIWLALILNAVK